MSEKPLYQDEKIKVDYLPNSTSDHLLFVKEKDGEWAEYIIQRGILQELARMPRGGIEEKIAVFNELILLSIKKEEIGIDGLHVALCQAYMEEEDRKNLRKDLL